MGKIIYLLGAGASANVLPIVRDIPSRASTIIGEISSVYNPAAGEQRDRLVEDLRWLREVALQHASVDTLAKKAFLKGDQTTLHRIKAAITALFYIIQVTKPADMRYDAFLASILNQQLKVPDNIKIVSWNYDFQFEKAYSNYVDDDNLSSLESKLSVANKFSPQGDFQNACIFKINGTTDIHNEQASVTTKLIAKTHIPDVKRFYQDFAINYHYSFYISENSKSRLSFAWESAPMITQVKQQIQDGTTLVVIGYSFPFFNREIDRMLFNDLRIRKVYIQDISGQNVVSRIKSILNQSNMEIEVINTVDQFFLPPQL